MTGQRWGLSLTDGETDFRLFVTNDPKSLRDLGVETSACNRVLIVDDRPENLAVLEALLDDEYDVHVAESGREAMAVLGRIGGADMVIADQRMPGMSGVQLLSRIAVASPETIRMVLTGYSDVAPIVDAVNHGSVYRFLLKPFEASELRAAVAEGLTLKRRREQLRVAVGRLGERRQTLEQTRVSLERAQDQLVAAERLSTVGRLTSGITHDINNQLGALMYLVDAVKEQTEEPPVLDAADSAFRTLQSLLHLLQDVKTFVRSQELELVRTPQDPATFVADTVGLLELDPVCRGRTIVTRIEPHCGRLMVDRNRLRQALLAVLRNAAQADPAAAPIRVRIFRADQDAGALCIEVRDEGCGMPPAVVERAPNPFFSAFDPPGMGLGLGIARMVCEAHGGHLTLLSWEGHGTAAQLWLGEEAVT